MKNIGRLKGIILAIGVLASVAFYVKEYDIGENKKIADFTVGAEYPEEEDNDDGTINASEKNAFEDKNDASDGMSERNIDSKTAVSLSEEDKAFIEQTIRTAVSEELYRISSEEGYLKNALEQAQTLAAQKAVENVGKVNINTAGVSELTTLEGIGEKRAGDIISYREQAGGFKSIEELMNIKGIKQAAFDKIRDKIYV